MRRLPTLPGSSRFRPASVVGALLLPLAAAERPLVDQSRQIPAGAIWSYDLVNRGDATPVQVRIRCDQPVLLRVLTAEAQGQRQRGERVDADGVLFEARSGDRDQLEGEVILGPGTTWVAIDNPGESAAAVRLTVTADPDAPGRGPVPETAAPAPTLSELLDVSDLSPVGHPSTPAANGLGTLPSLDEVGEAAPRSAADIPTGDGAARE